MFKKDFDKARKQSEPSPTSIRFNWSQKEQLTEEAQGQPLGTYIKSILFHTKDRVNKTYSELDKKLIARLLGALGKSRLASNLNQLAKAANSGSLPVNEDVLKAIMRTCQTIEWMRITLIKALGLKPHRKNTKENDHNDFER